MRATIVPINNNTETVITFAEITEITNEQGGGGDPQVEAKERLNKRLEKRADEKNEKNERKYRKNVCNKRFIKRYKRQKRK